MDLDDIKYRKIDNNLIGKTYYRPIAIHHIYKLFKFQNILSCIFRKKEKN